MTCQTIAGRLIGGPQFVTGPDGSRLCAFALSPEPSGSRALPACVGVRAPYRLMPRIEKLAPGTRITVDGFIRLLPKASGNGVIADIYTTDVTHE